VDLDTADEMDWNEVEELYSQEQDQLNAFAIMDLTGWTAWILLRMTL